LADSLTSGVAILSAVAAILMTVFVVLASTMRYAVGDPFSFTEELVGLLFTAMIFVGLPVCVYRQSNISVTIVTDLLPAGLRRIADIAALILMIIFFLWFAYLSFDYAKSLYQLGGRTTGSRLLLWPWAALMPVSCMLAAIAAAIRIVVPKTQDDGAASGGGI
jgi:TRAP-type C4-dicarboxylate transport system permease small subunit